MDSLVCPCISFLSVEKTQRKNSQLKHLFQSSIYSFRDFKINNRAHTLPLSCQTWCRPAADTRWWRWSGARSPSPCNRGKSRCSEATPEGQIHLRSLGYQVPQWEEEGSAPALSDQTNKKRWWWGVGAKTEPLLTQVFPSDGFWPTTTVLPHLLYSFAHKELILKPHQLRLAPADAVAGDAAEVAAPGGLHLGPCRTLFLMLRPQHHQKAVWEVLLRPHLHIHPDQSQNFVKHATHASQRRGSLFTLQSDPPEAEELCRHDPGRCWCSLFPRPPCPTASVNPALSHPGQKRAALSQSPSAWWRTLPDKAASCLETRAEAFTSAPFYVSTRSRLHRPYLLPLWWPLCAWRPRSFACWWRRSVRKRNGVTIATF